MTDYLDPEAPSPDHHAEQMRLTYVATLGDGCIHCQLPQRSHINDRFCPEWRLRQLSGDR